MIDAEVRRFVEQSIKDYDSGVSKTSGTSGNSSADSQFISLSNDIKELRADLQAQIDSLDVRVTALENP